MGYSAIASPLTDLLKKNKAWIWDEEFQAAFESLKKAVMEEPLLSLPDSRKLNETERKYTMQEKEMTVVVHCLRIWRHYLLGSRFVIKTDNITTSYFQTQKKLSPKQARWEDFLAEFDYQLEYKPGKANVVADTLSCKAEFAAITQASSGQEDHSFSERREDPKILAQGRHVIHQGRSALQLFKITGTNLNFSMSFHPQTDRQTERVNALLELYLRHYVSANQHDWAKLLDVAQLSYNMQRSDATGKSPFELVMGRQPLTPNALAISYEGSSPTAYKTIKEWHEQANLARASLDKVAKKMKKWAEEKRRHVEFEVGDQVMVKLLPQQFKSLRKVHKGLIRSYEGPFPVIEIIGKVEEILSDCMIRRRGVPGYKEYLIKWRDLPDSEASWEAEDLVWQFTDEIKKYHKDGTTRTSRA
ncbi:putative nucleotidyltransferase, ribonuclease H [Tanacetum coccineum]